MTSAHRLLSTFHPELALLAEQAEQSLWTNPRAMLLQGRLFAERLAKIIAQESKVEPVYEIKQADRLHMLERRGVIDADIRSGFEWLRMHGNAAAHNAKEVPADIALTAHRHIYELSAWFTEAYGPLTVEVPEYAMPMPPASKAEGGLSAESLSAAFQQMIEEHVSGKLLSSIDRKFQDMQDTLDKFAGNVEEWARKTAVDAVGENMKTATIAEQQAKSDETAAAAEVHATTQGVEIAEYLGSLSLSVLDKRTSGGALWVIGGWELNGELFKLKPQGFYFRFARKGSQSTKRKPAWFLIGKDPTEPRYVNAIAPTGATVVPTKPESAKSQQLSEKPVAASPEPDVRTVSRAVPIAAQSEEDEPQGEMAQSGPEEEEHVVIPRAIGERELADYEPSRLSEISRQMGIPRFQDWTEERLKELYRKQPKQLHDVLVQLWFFGVEFRGELGRFLRLQRSPESATAIELVPGMVLAERLPLDVVRMLERFGIRVSDQLNGIPHTSLEWLLRGRYSDAIQILEYWKPEHKQTEKFSHGLIEQVVEEYEGLICLEQYGWWTTRMQEEFEQEADKLRRSLYERIRGRNVSLDHIWEIVPILSDQLPVKLGVQVVMSGLRVTADGQYFWAGSKKSDVVEMVLRQYPEGVELYKRAKELYERANRIRPDEFVRDREFTSVIQRDEFADAAYLWGRGTYIHSSFVKADVSLIEEIVHAAAALLEKRSPISVGRLFHADQERLVGSGVPNEYALYTLLRKYGSDKLAPNKFPHIWHKDDAFQLSNGELIKVFLRERQEPQTMEELREEFVRRRGWKRFTLEFSISVDSDFVSVNYGVIGLREFYPFHERDFEPMVRQLASLLAETDVIHVNRLFDSAKHLCDRMGIGSPYLLYDLLQGMHPAAFRFARYPLICAEGHPLKDITLLGMVEQYVGEQEAEVPRELVYQWVTEKVGARETTLDNVLAASANIYYYRGGQFGEYIHRNRLGWTEEKEEALIAYVNACLDQALAGNRHYVTVEEVWAPSRFPALGNDLEWTEDLFIDCLRKSGKCKLLGSMDCIAVPFEHARISDETDLIEYILESDFHGKAPLKVLQRKLAEVRYSKDGTWLFETMSRLESGVAPFVVESDVVMSKTELAPK